MEHTRRRQVGLRLRCVCGSARGRRGTYIQRMDTERQKRAERGVFCPADADPAVPKRPGEDRWGLSSALLSCASRSFTEVNLPANRGGRGVGKACWCGEPLALKPRQRPFLQHRCLRTGIPEGLQRRCDKGQGNLNFEARERATKGSNNALKRRPLVG